jgi:hypothetical protein
VVANAKFVLIINMPEICEFLVSSFLQVFYSAAKGFNITLSLDRGFAPMITVEPKQNLGLVAGLLLIPVVLYFSA